MSCGNTDFAAWQDTLLGSLNEKEVSGDSKATTTAGVTPESSDARATICAAAVGRWVAACYSAGIHPLDHAGIKFLTGVASYDPVSTLNNTGALAVSLARSLGVPHFALEDFISLYSVIQENAFFDANGRTLRLHRVLSLLNHSCQPNVAIVRGPDAYDDNSVSGFEGSSSHVGSVAAVDSSTAAASSPHPTVRAGAYAPRRLVALTNIAPGEQLCVSYDPSFTSLPYTARAPLIQQRGFVCRCARCLTQK
jgi:hypothetical protein